MNLKSGDEIRGGGVGACIKESIKKKNSAKTSRCPDVGHPWLEEQGRNKHIN